MRVHELAKELGLTSTTVLEILAGLKVAAKSHSSSIDDVTADRVRRQVKGKSTQPPSPPAPSRVAKTASGERILGMRKIALPPPPPATPVVEVPAESPLETSRREVAPERAAPPRPDIGPVKAKPGEAPEEIKAPPLKAPKVEPEMPPTRPAIRPDLGQAAKVVPAPAPPRVVPTDVRPTKGVGSTPTRTIVKPMPPRKEAPPRAPAPQLRPPAEVSPAAQVIPAVPPVTPAPSAAPPREPPLRKLKERILPPPPEQPAAPPVVPAEIELVGPLTVGELASRLEIAAGEVVKRLLEQGILAGINHQIPQEVATKVAEAFGSSVRRSASPLAAQMPAPKRLEIAKDPESVLRPPVVTILGHVDHGKTTLLDAIRQTNVAEHEFGGITQHIGASTVEVDGRSIVFIDTPGHEAFTALRARGAQVTDIAVLVVAADDGVMPQTVEAINHARAAGVPIIVAINKTDLPQANPEKAKQQLADLGLAPEAWGGDTVTLAVSARTRQGLKELLEMILLVSELHELQANPKRPARGTVIEATLDKGRGPVATVLVQEGTLRIGDAVVAGETYGRVRAMVSARGERLSEATPSTPVEVVGLDSMPGAGDLLEVVHDDRLGKAVAEERRERRRAVEVVRPGAVEEIYAQAGGPKELRLVVKADAHGSVEALTTSLGRLASPEVGVIILHTAVGNITESDVMLAAASRAVIVGFSVRPEPQVRRLAEQQQIEILSYRVIYEAIDDIRQRLRGLLAPKRREVALGQVEVRQTFTVSKIGTVAGCYVTTGVMARGASVRVIRDGVVVHEGKIASLRRFKEDVREVTEGFECGIGLERFPDVKVGDVLEAFEIREEPA